MRSGVKRTGRQQSEMLFKRSSLWLNVGFRHIPTNYAAGVTVAVTTHTSKSPATITDSSKIVKVRLSSTASGCLLTSYFIP